MAELTSDKEVISKEPIDSPILSDNETGSSKVNEKALLRKIDRRLLPAVGILYLLSFLDRSNGMIELYQSAQNTYTNLYLKLAMLASRDFWAILICV